MSESKYINGVFISKKEGKFGEFLSIGISEEGLKALQALEKSASGFRNFTASPQKADPNKFSAKPGVAKANSGVDEDLLPF
jgi:hypothetical protein